MGSYRVCVCFIRKFRVTEAEPPADVKAAFKKYAEGGTHLTAEQLRRFLVEVQGEDATADETDAVVLKILQKRHPIAKFTRHALTLDDFHHFLFSPEFNPPMVSKVHHDMNAPLSHYFIYTGHNSYLTGNQLTSDCSDVPIIKALQRGVRVIELDIWPNSAKDDVNVLHGRTVTAPVELIRCLKSIKEHAFVASPYPVVITLEDHLTPDLQAKVAMMLIEAFGDMLLIPETECLKSLPSPEQLKHRVVISTKPPKESFETSKEKQSRMDDDDDDDDVWGNEPSTLTADKEDNHDSEDDDDDLKTPQTPAYKGLIAIHAGKPKGGMEEKLKVEPDKVRRLSLSEQALEKAAESHGTDVVRFTQRNILRIYPKGTRFNSSNYKPLIGWMHGAQMVAFNMQGYGRSLWLMQGMFRSNGGCGYVKKPDLLMNLDKNHEVFNPKIRLSVKKTLIVKVYMGDGWHLDFKRTHFDSYSPPDFYTRGLQTPFNSGTKSVPEVGIAGVPADEAMHKTKTKYDNWTPVWEEHFTFPLTVPELALLRIEVHEHDMPEKDDFGGQTCLPVSELRPGIRAVPLCDRKGEKLCCCLFGFKQGPTEAPEHVRRVFADYSGEDGMMSIENLLRFLTEFQKEANATREMAQEIISSVMRLNLIIQPKGLVFEEFFHYLLSELNTPLNTEIRHDMNAPLAHYYIFTGHNSYLTGNQLSSKSSVNPIIKALQKGVRVIELDLWPNSRKDDVDVCHGGTLTSPVKLIKCLKAIKSYAFVASKYPLIITFEDHLTPDLQAKVAGMVKRTFGSMLFCPESELYEFPSPESLKEKIMISTKPPKQYSELGRANNEPSQAQADSEEGVNDEEEDGANEIPEYKNLIAIHAGKLKGSIRNLPSHDGKVTRLSMSEETLELAAKKHGSELIKFTQRNLLRVFPKGTRITSSNYNPFVGWTHGAQMVAFNMQGYAKDLWIMQGMFRANGCCGYVKKPDFLLGDGYYDEVFDPLALPIKTTLKVYVYMGEGWRQDFHFRHFDYLSPPDFYTKMSIVGVTSDRTKSERTRIIEDEWVPMWNGEEFEFPLRVPELALLRIEVKDYDPTGENEFGGQTCLPVSELKTGFRSVPLYDHRGDKYRSVKLLMGFEFI